MGEKRKREQMKIMERETWRVNGGGRGDNGGRCGRIGV
jgi:hypothetical protein